ncbi:hypothetical protein HMPREF1989_01656 [Porphyromonas gingivalis F0566]|uniref:hypothetical protein n=1 Tax=Porphyromonas gingivalis TaxID=837 RepID=UPI0003ACEDF9|nr:hypothetical protein [Porphyromonas gingivalis]ERJ85402.1 hypothetical protein HMPREF1989_01656 [Porphyromonas gingivalis F0566]
MKHLLFTLLLSLLGCLGAKAQQTLSFVYDASGNRVARVIIMSSIIATGEEPSEEDEAVQAEENLLCQSAKMTLLEREDIHRGSTFALMGTIAQIQLTNTEQVSLCF